MHTLWSKATTKPVDISITIENSKINGNNRPRCPISDSNIAPLTQMVYLPLVTSGFLFSSSESFTYMSLRGSRQWFEAHWAPSLPLPSIWVLDVRLSTLKIDLMGKTSRSRSQVIIHANSPVTSNCKGHFVA